MGYEDHIAGNTRGQLSWPSQWLEGITFVAADDAAVLTAAGIGEVSVDGGEHTFRLQLTQAWIRTPEGWRYLTGHAGQLDNPAWQHDSHAHRAL